ncbi:hotdog fold thioesterase [Aequorivita sp. H23M31]|uniref:Hotdog fold thioesterase n=1 Tax=Aequorivita ciconiae TaxID=2494375 RepID=A0A410G084_9FLAO|nr:hotdog fold thioesterase [Aequorivita sp. H23M31]QAA80674.1 hotdog fold thioesterase [Aequorivita sp. H23M31]
MVENTFDLIKHTFEESIPLHKFLGLEIMELDNSFVKIRVPFKKELVGDFRTNRWHGGIIATIMDSVGGVIGATHFTSMEDKISTIDLRVDYLKGAEPIEVIVVGKIVRMGNRILVAKMKAFQNDELIAEGKGVYNFVRMNNEKTEDEGDEIRGD